MLAFLAAAAMMQDPNVYDGNFTVDVMFRADQAGRLAGNRESDDERGWTIGVDESGAWYWAASDGETKYDYRPTAKRQRVVRDGNHTVAFTLRRDEHEVRLFFDRRLVAILNVDGLDSVSTDVYNLAPTAGGIGSRTVYRRALSDAELTDDPALPERRERFTVLAFNIWHAGKEDGEEGFKRLLDTMREADADIVCMIETYGSGPEIADEMGYSFYLRSTNLSIHSRFPIGRTFDYFKAFNFGGAEIKISQTQTLRVFDTWLHYLPSTQADISGDKTVNAILKGEMETRGGEIKEILKQIARVLAESDEYPVIMAGDFNSGSHLDWTEGTKHRYNGYVVPWPVTVQMEEAGFIDAFRTIYPDPLENFGRTWSPRFKEALQYRIDYVFHHGPRLRPVSAKVFDSHPGGFASDHAAVLVEYEWVD
ncbi:MAG: endonuclease/exonuclease/phosphatase family protein [Armatimonadetes bacterium]|nr:endonuclease/exonuclease/phosphatase family protein [Armatimonadota bacterium]